jgi:zinc protease
MKMTRLAAPLIALLLAVPAIAQVRHPKEIKTPPLRQLTQPQPKRVALPNGMVILLIEDHELPLIRGTARIRGGGREVPADKAGLAGILGQAWRTGGTKSRTGDQLDEFLESRAAIVETGATDDSLNVSMNVLKQDFDTVFPIFLELLREPEFRQEKIDLAKTQANTAISRRNDEPGAILAREASKLGYGADSPYARQPEYATIAAITRDDLLAFHKRVVHPNNIILGLVGDFDSKTMEAKLRKAFSSWPKGPAAPPPPTAGTPAKPGVYFVAKDDVNQSNVAMVHTGTTRNNPDYAALQVLNEILNSERLFPHIRTQQGLAYSVFGVVGTGWDHPGLFRAQVGTKSETTAQAINSLRAELDALHNAPFTADEMQRAKDSILNAHVFTIDSKAKVLNQAMDLEFYGYPSDWYAKYPSLVQKVTAEDVARVAKKYVTPSNISLLVVGKEKDFDKPLSTFGTVTPIDITIPEPGAKPGEKAAAPAAGNAEGTALVARMQEFAGGKAKLDAIKSVRYVQSMSNKTPQGPMDMEADQFIVFPDRIRAVMKMPMGEITMVTTPDAAFMSMGGMGVRDMPGSQRDAIRGQIRGDLLTVLKYPERYTLAVTGTEKVGNVDAKVLEVTAEGDTARFLVDAATGKPLRKISRSRNPMMQGDIITEYTEWKTFGGVNFPTAATSTHNGEQVGSVTVKSVEINPAVDTKLFEKPAA